MKKIIGIDLGTTNSCVSVIEGNNPTIIPNSEGRRTTPSIVSFIDGSIKIGDPAKRQMVVNGDKTVYSVKRLMGMKYDEIKNEIGNLPYKVKKGRNDMAVIDINGKDYTPQEVSSMILQKMKKTAEDYLGTTVDSAIITVPAYFSDSQRQATKEAGEIAGLKVERIINEPTAAALSYGLDKIEKNITVAVFDLGGGTFDISILDLGDGVFEVKSTNGDTQLGGDDFDQVIIDWLSEEFKKDFPKIDLRKDRTALQRMKEAAEKAKIELSSSVETEINLPYIIPIDNVPQHLVKKLTRSKFEQLSSSLLDRLIGPCEKALSDSKIDKSKIDEVILVGGSTRMLSVQEIVKKIFNKEPSKNVNPDESVSVGASIQGAVLSGEITDVLLLDVTPLSLGIETMGGIMTKLIESNTTIPVTKSETFSTAVENQPSVEIHVLQGERPMARDNKTLGRFHLDGIPPSPRGVPQIEVKFDIDSNGILSVSATDKSTGKNQQIRIEGSTNLNKDEIERMKMEAEENLEKDNKEKEKIDKLNQADTLIFTTEKQIKDLSEKITKDDKIKIDEKLNQLKESHKNQDMDNIDTHINELNEVWQTISTKLYSQSNTQQSTPDDVKTDVEDVEFEEVKNK
jgi:molecular chaperone DnaK